MRIGVLAKEAGVSSRTIDYYTQLGLIREEARSCGKHRLYSEKALNTIKIIKEMQKQHYSLDEICKLLRNGLKEDYSNKMIEIRRSLDELQAELTKLHPILHNEELSAEMKTFSRELASKGMQVMQFLLMLVGDQMF